MGLNPYIFQREETVVLLTEVKNSSSGSYTDPGSMIIHIYDPTGSAMVSGSSMTKDSTGNYHYDFTPGTADATGVYTVVYTAITGARVAKRKDHFTVEVP